MSKEELKRRKREAFGIDDMDHRPARYGKAEKVNAKGASWSADIPA
jgi:hypothetical protein